ncbi:MAG: purine-binding chemotaxis protein CheW [Sandaracinus sp.]|nr:purine-binding chemotaxis protein CheW [Myxococcales bacterium]MCB9601821.1 purine-binding chemotaxis protein CheW [Sandaracinus sp.]MCB9611553.1 purine-binding chemotaxis protein CheW [Sandaracinus sp.]
MSDLVKRPTMVPARPGVPETKSAPSLREVLAFSLADDTYGFPLARVREILKLPPITPVPRAPRYVLGIVSVRGVITTVVDLRRLMRVEERLPEKHARILLVDVGGEVVGALVDEVQQVHRLAEDEVELAQAVGGDLSDHVIGVGRPRTKREIEDAGRELIVLLDPEPLFARIERG